MIAQHLHALLRAALPPEVPVLLPEQAQEPLTAAPTDAQGRPRVGGGERGLGAYLAERPGGYVQIGRPVGIGASLTVTTWHPVTTLAPDEATCHALAQQVLTVLCGTPGRAPGQFARVLYAPPTTDTPGVWTSTLTVRAVTLDGALIPGA